MRAKYLAGELIKAGDRIRYHGDPGFVDFVATERCGDPDIDWFTDEFPGGGVMICSSTMGSVFLGLDDLGDLLEFESRPASG